MHETPTLEQVSILRRTYLHRLAYEQSFRNPEGKSALMAYETRVCAQRQYEKALAAYEAARQPELVQLQADGFDDINLVLFGSEAGYGS
jgi:hypothetical protein